MSFILRDLSSSKGNYSGEFKFDNIPRYFPGERVLTKSWETNQGFTDVYVGGKLDGFPGKRFIKNAFVCYRTFFGEVLPDTEKKIAEIKQEFEKQTHIPISISVQDHYKTFERSGPGIFITQNTEVFVPIDPLIEVLEKIEKAIAENESLLAEKIRKTKE